MDLSFANTKQISSGYVSLKRSKVYSKLSKTNKTNSKNSQTQDLEESNKIFLNDPA